VDAPRQRLLTSLSGGWVIPHAEFGAETASADPHVGGTFPHGARRAIRYGDGWIPGGDIREVLPEFGEMARESGPYPAGIEITSFALGEDLDRVNRLNGRCPRGADVPAREGRQGTADRGPVDENPAAGQLVKPGRIDPGW